MADAPTPTCSCGRGFHDNRPGPGHYGSCPLTGTERTLAVAEEDLRWARANGERFRAERKAAEAVVVELCDALAECAQVLGLIGASGHRGYFDLSLKAQARANELVSRLAKAGA